ncbi:SPOR domain-containing protein [Amphritea sp. HPY]|uniref:SPOR domain-containing protein n=1 Tax=Amphritea sp. HPY TaxID=3421652 RepID=UPI003D7D5132
MLTTKKSGVISCIVGSGLFMLSCSVLAAGAKDSCIEQFAQTSYDAAFTSCSAIAAKDPDAAFIMARLYLMGSAGKPDLGKSVEWLQRATDLGHAEAAYNLGIAYQYGQSVNKDLTRARDAYQRAIAGNNAKAMRNLALMYEIGNGVKQDAASAFQLYLQSAGLGLSDSQLKTAVMLLQGTGVVADPVQGRYWLEKAAESGDADAQLQLAMLLAEIDFMASLGWYEKSAEQDNPYAMHNLALIYFQGEYLPQDTELALAYARSSVRLGHRPSDDIVQAIVMEQKAAGQSLAAHTPAAQSAANNTAKWQGDETVARLPDGWIMEQAAERYVIQLNNGQHENGIQKYIHKHDLSGPVHYYRTRRIAGIFYVLVYGEYDTVRAAKQALQELPPAVQKDHWIRSVAKLQDVYRQP